MKEQARELVEKMEDLERQYMKAFDLSDLIDLDHDAVKTIKKCKEVADAYKNLLMEHAEVISNMNEKIDNIDRKLDMLLTHRD